MPLCFPKARTIILLMYTFRDFFLSQKRSQNLSQNRTYHVLLGLKNTHTVLQRVSQ